MHGGISPQVEGQMNKQHLSLKRHQTDDSNCVNSHEKGGGGLFHKIALEKNMLNMPSPYTVVRNKIRLPHSL